MITIGTRTRSWASKPGFSFGELKEEAVRRGISVKDKDRGVLERLLVVKNSSETGGHERSELGIPEVLYHRNIAVTCAENVIKFYDLDAFHPRAGLLGEFFLKGVKCAGVTSSGKIVTYVYENSVLMEFRLASPQEMNEGKWERVNSPDMYRIAMYPFGVVGEKVLFTAPHG